MNKSLVLSLLAVGFLSACSSPENTVDEKYLTVGSVEVAPVLNTEFEKKAASSAAIGSVDCSATKNVFGMTSLDDVTGAIDPVDQLNVYVDKIINIGKKVWAIVKAGEPVANFRSDIATAMPAGVGCWTDLQGWSRPVSQSWGVSFKNLYGVEVTKLVYRVVFLPNGTVEGQGKYIGYASVLPEDVSVAWGYNFDASASVPTVFNMGTSKNPKAGMQINVNWRVKTVLKSVESAQAFFVSGTGEVSQVK